MQRKSAGIGMTMLLCCLAALLGSAAARTTTPAAHGTPAAPTTISVQGVIQSVTANGVPMGTHLQVLVDGQSLDVYVGLQQLVGVDASAFQAGDTVQITGQLVKTSGAGSMLIAWKIQDGNQVYQLRNGHGLPVLHGGRRS